MKKKFGIVFYKESALCILLFCKSMKGKIEISFHRTVLGDKHFVQIKLEFFHKDYHLKSQKLTNRKH